MLSILQFKYLWLLTLSSVSLPTLGLYCLLLGHTAAHRWRESAVADVFCFSGHPVYLEKKVQEHIPSIRHKLSKYTIYNFQFSISILAINLN